MLNNIMPIFLLAGGLGGMSGELIRPTIEQTAQQHVEIITLGNPQYFNNL